MEEIEICEDNISALVRSQITGGQTITVHLFWNTLEFTGVYDLIIVVDYDNQLYELDKDNNQLIYDYQITILQHDPGDNSFDYNLRTCELEVIPTICYVGETVTIRYTYRNQGWKNLDDFTLRILENGTIIHDENVDISAFEDLYGNITWNSIGFIGEIIFELTLDPLNNITEFNNSDDLASATIYIYSIPPPIELFEDDYNIANWTIRDNSSILNDTNISPANGKNYWRTINEVGYANLSIPYINLYSFGLENETINSYYINFSSSYFLGVTQNKGYLYLRFNNSQNLYNLAEFSGINENCNKYSINLWQYVDKNNISRDNHRFSREVKVR